MSLPLHFCPVCCTFTVSLSTSDFTHHNICQCNACCQMNSSSTFLLPVTCFEFGFELMGHNSTILTPLRLFRAGALALHPVLCPPAGLFVFFRCLTGSDPNSFLSSSQTWFGKHRRGGSLVGWKVSLLGLFFSHSRRPGLTLPVFLLSKDVT